jgi:c-di-GMP-binding flagellar brake protein YcgR
VTRPARDRRRHRRYDVEDVRGNLLFTTEVRILNLSLTGMAIETDVFLKVEGRYHLKIRSNEHPLDLEVVVKWCHLDRTERRPDGDVAPVYKAGLDFKDVLGERAREILAFIEDHIVVELDRRILGRFRVEVGDEVDLATTYDFRVLKISRSGMLIRTELEPPVDSRFEMEIRPRNHTVQVLGRVADVSLPTTPPVSEEFEVGVEFVEIANGGRRHLSSFIEELIE